MALTNQPPATHNDPFHPELSVVLDEEFGPVAQQKEEEVSIFDILKKDGTPVFLSLDARHHAGYTGDHFEILNNHPRLSTDNEGRPRSEQLKKLVAFHNYKHNFVVNPEMLPEECYLDRDLEDEPPSDSED